MPITPPNNLPSQQSPPKMTDAPQTDVPRPSALPSARLRPQGSSFASSSGTAGAASGSGAGSGGGSSNMADMTSAEYLDAMEEEWNKKVDVEIDALMEGMVDLVGLAGVSVVYFWNLDFLLWFSVENCLSL